MIPSEVEERLSAADAALDAAQTALAELRRIFSTPDPPPAAAIARPLAWGAKVSRVFRERVHWLVEDLDIGPEPGKPEPNWLMTWIAWESGRSFRADVKNMAGSGATGLIQFMPDTARALGTSVEKLATMTPEDQLNYVWKYFKPYTGRIRSLADGYMAILWPAGVGKPESYVLWDKGERPTTYRQNAGLDVNADGRITKAEAVAKVAALLPEGLSALNAANADALLPVGGEP